MYMICLRNEEKEKYKIVDLTAIEDPRLTLKATAVHTYMITRPPNWKINIKDIINHFKDGRDSILNAIKNLEENNYIYRTQQRSELGIYMSTTYLVSEKPINKESFELILSENPLTAFPVTGYPVTENTTLTNKEYSKKKNLLDIIEEKEPSIISPAIKDAENILACWNDRIKDIKGISKHSSINSKVSVSGKSNKYEKIIDVIQQVKLVYSVDEIKSAIINYTDILTSDKQFFSYKFKNLGQFFTSQKGLQQFSDPDVSNKFSNSYSDPWSAIRNNLKFINYSFDPKKPLDKFNQTYLGIPVKSIKDLNVQSIIKDVTDKYKLELTQYGHIEWLEQCIAYILFNKTSIDLLREVVDLHRIVVDVVVNTKKIVATEKKA